MADFLESEAEESEIDSEDEQPAERKKPKRKAAVQSDDEDEDEEDDEERLREELKDLIDDAPIEESGSDGEDSDASAGPKKRKKSDDELDDRLEDEDYDLIEENLGVKVARYHNIDLPSNMVGFLCILILSSNEDCNYEQYKNKFKRLRRLDEDDDSDNEGNDDPELEREVIAEKLFVGGSDEEDENRSESAAPRGEAEYDDENEDLESDADDFIVDDDGRPIAERKKKRKPIFTDARKMKQARKRKYWVHPMLMKRIPLGLCQSYIEELKSDDGKFYEYLRMTVSTFDSLLARLADNLRRENTYFRNCISAEERLVITLRYLASGCSFKQLHYNFRVGMSTISKIIKETCSVIWSVLSAEYLKLPNTEEEWKTVAEAFKTKANFPHCLGALDGKHIRITKPINSGSMFFNYKDYFSFILFAIVDSEYRFIYVSIGSYGKECDSSILKQSNFWKKLNDGTLNIPRPTPLHENMQEEIPYVFVGDEAFTLSQNLLRPYGGTHLDNKKKIFNYRLSRARRYVECTFGEKRRTKKGKPKRPSKKSIFEIYEPSELKRSHFTDLDNEIRKTDVPERMQTREVPITPVEEGSTELEDEAEWIYKQAFLKPPVSKPDAQEARERTRRGNSTITKIRQALDFMRNQTLEVPFIAFYRKEYVQPELSINDLWKVYKYDAKWCQLKQRKENLLKLFENMREYQLDKVMENPDAPIPDNMRLIKDEDIERLKNVQTSEELRDVHTHFLLYYSTDLPEMQKVQRSKEKKRNLEEKKRLAREEADRNGEDPEEAAAAVEAAEPNEEEVSEVLFKSFLKPLVKKFGLSPEQFAENVRDNYQRHEVEQQPVPPLEAAAEYVSTA
ncbi:hypothetical protein HF086_015361 [Spodoptera exigua]|uniref:DDE Tnp4 domain-containing protein n=1 Tax=Spodoptera exigua TaxID=7107 RepID=A0A922S823_SPOEX|nr:hypothetical protein HF086_015361 [Spodoptera exigua]